MIRAVSIASKVGVGQPVADTVVLDFDGRHRRRVALKAAGGLEFLLDLAEVPSLRDGDGLVLEDGRVVLVRAADEALMEIAASDPRHLARLAWHLGNRHLPAQILDRAIRIRADHVIADMAIRLGAAVTEVSAPFDPEGGAYGGGTHGHGHAHHDHAHG